MWLKKMKIKHLYIASIVFLGACAAPTSSYDLLNEKKDKDGYIFYQNEQTYLHVDDLKDKLKHILIENYSAKIKKETSQEPINFQKYPKDLIGKFIKSSQSP